MNDIDLIPSLCNFVNKARRGRRISTSQVSRKGLQWLKSLYPQPILILGRFAKGLEVFCK